MTQDFVSHRKPLGGRDNIRLHYTALITVAMTAHANLKSNPNQIIPLAVTLIAKHVTTGLSALLPFYPLQLCFAACDKEEEEKKS